MNLFQHPRIDCVSLENLIKAFVHVLCYIVSCAPLSGIRAMISDYVVILHLYCGVYETYSIISLVIVCVYCDWLCYIVSCAPLSGIRAMISDYVVILHLYVLLLVSCINYIYLTPVPWETGTHLCGNAKMKKIGHACISKVIVNIDTIFTGVTNTEIVLKNPLVTATLYSGTPNWLLRFAVRKSID